MKPPMPTLLLGDARALPLPDASVDLVACSPPYLGLRDYGADGQIGAEATPGEFLDALIACTQEMVRVLKPSGSIWVNLGDSYNSAASGQNLLGKKERDPGGRSGTKRYPGTRGRETAAVPVKSLHLVPHRYAIRCVDELGLILRQDQVWAKANPIPDSATDRTGRVHEYLFHLTKSPRYFADLDELREAVLPDAAARNARYTGQYDGQNPHRNDKGAGWMGSNPLGKLPGSVWSIAGQPLRVPAELGVDHFASWPMEIPRRLIQGWSPHEVCTACGLPRSGGKSAAILNQSCGETTCGTNAIVQSLTATESSHPTAPMAPLRISSPAGAPATLPPTRPGVVLDPFSGTGTTALVATMLGRRGIGVELNPDYIRLAEWRAADPKERARAAGLDPDAVAKLAPQLPGQFDLLDLEDDGAAS